MTQPDNREQELLPEHEERVRRLLAEARHDGELPADVAARLDRVLAELAAGGSRGPRSPVELAARRRRRVRGMLVAAAAAAVVGIGLGQVVPGSGEDSPSAVTADSVGGSVSAGTGSAGSAGRLQDPSGGQATDEDPAPAASAPSGAAEDDAQADGEAAPESMLSESSQELSPGTFGDRRGLVLAHGRPVRVRAERFAADAVRARDRLDAGRRATKGGRGFACDQAGWGPGTAVGVLYGGRPHVLVFREPAGDTQVVDLLQCGTGETLRSTTLRAG